MRTELDEEIVFAAMKAVLARGEYPSQARVRAELGSTASVQTIGRMVTAGYKRLGGAADDLASDETPSYVMHAAKRMYAEIHEQAQSDAQVAIDDAQTLAAKRQQSLDQVKADLETTGEQMAYLRQQHDDALSELEDLRQRVTDLSASLATANERNEKLEERFGESRRSAAGTVRSARASARQRESALNDELTEARKERDWLRDYSESERDRLLREIDQLRMSYRDIAGKLEIEQKAHNATKDALGDMTKAQEQSEAALKMQREQAGTRIETLEREIDRFERARQDDHDALSSRERELEQCRADCAEHQQHAAAAVGERDVARALAEERYQHIQQLTARFEQEK